MRVGEAPSGSSSIPVYLDIGNPGESDARFVRISSVMADRAVIYVPKPGGGQGEVVKADSLTSVKRKALSTISRALRPAMRAVLFRPPPPFGYVL